MLISVLFDRNEKDVAKICTKNIDFDMKNAPFGMNDISLFGF